MNRGAVPDSVGWWEAKEESLDKAKQAEFVRRYIRLQEAADALHARAEEVHEMARELEDLTKDTKI